MPGLPTTRSDVRIRRTRGMAIILVLGMLAITLALAYAALHGLGLTTLVARNGSRALDARTAARSGVSAALRKISQSDWQGVNVPLSANITDDAWYEVTFTTGDRELASSDPAYLEYPFRLTIEATGYAADPADPSIRAMHQSRCVVQLVRRALQPAPANWPALTNHTVYQWSNFDAEVQLPVRIGGQALIHGRIFLAQEYPSTTASREQYLSDLNGMRLNGRGDHRPFDSPLTLALGNQSGSTLTDLQTRLGLVLVDSLRSTNTPLAHPGSVASYRLYPGGQEYNVPVLQDAYGSTLQNVTLGPDPATNPLGVFRSSGALSLRDNVRITGTVIADALSNEVHVVGKGVVLQAADLPALYGSSAAYRLPAALVHGDLRVGSSSDAQIQGFSMVWDEFELQRGSPSTRFAMRGNLVTKRLLLRGRDTWTMTSTAWQADLDDYKAARSGDGGGLLGSLVDSLVGVLNDIRAALGLGSSDHVYFPEWEQHQRGFTIKPALTFQPDSSGVRPHWQDWSQPVYRPAVSDAGLRWDVIRWEDGL